MKRVCDSLKILIDEVAEDLTSERAAKAILAQLQYQIGREINLYDGDRSLSNPEYAYLINRYRELSSEINAKTKRIHTLQAQLTSLRNQYSRSCVRNKKEIINRFSK